MCFCDGVVVKRCPKTFFCFCLAMLSVMCSAPLELDSFIYLKGLYFIVKWPKK